ATEGDYDQTVSVDPFTNLAKLSIPIEELSEEAEDELKNGVGITYTALDASGNSIATASFSKVLFLENGNQMSFNISALPYQQVDLSFNPDMPYFLQIVDANGNYGDQAVEKSVADGSNLSTLYQDNSTFRATWSNHQYYFQAHPGETNVFSIYSRHTSRYLNVGDDTRKFFQSGARSYPVSPGSLHPRYKFIIKREENGLFTLRDYNNIPLRKGGTVDGKTFWQAKGSGEIQHFRIVALDIDWDMQELDTKQLQPIFPAAQTSFGFNSTLINCGSGSLEQEVGIEKTITTTYTTGFEESISVGSRVTTSLEATVGATAEASFFGNGGSVSAEVSAGLEVSIDVTSTRTQSQEYSTSETQTYFSKRTVTVPPGKASLVYDAYQTYSNVKIPYVKRMLVRATNQNNGQLLSGRDIQTLFLFFGFNGGITAIGPDYIEISIRGTTTLDNIVDTKSGVQDVPGKCD
ncbi:MAG: hypothetical protein AAF206_30440, partial [Bacteroidota bacterium]